MSKIIDFLKILKPDTKFHEVRDGYHSFCKKIEDTPVDLLVSKTETLHTWANKQGAIYHFNQGLDSLCERNIVYAKSYFNELLSLKGTSHLEPLDRLLSGIFKKDYKRASSEILRLINSDNEDHKSKGITTVGFLDLSSKECDDFKATIETELSNLIEDSTTNKILANVLFAYRNNRKELPNADKHIETLMQIDSDDVRYQLYQLLLYELKIEEESDFFKNVLFKLTNLNTEYVGLYNSLSYQLSRLTTSHYDTVKQFLNIWVETSPENASKIKLFNSVFNEIYDAKKQQFDELITEWLNNNNINFQVAVFNVLRELSYRNAHHIQLSSRLLKTYSYIDIEFIVHKIIGFIYEKDMLTTLLYSILETKYTEKEVVQLVGSRLVNDVIFNYYSAIEFLKEKKKDAVKPLKKIIDEIVFHGEKFYEAYSDLDILKEFQPSEMRLNHMNKIQSKKFRKDYEENEANDTGFLSMLTTLHFRSGKTSFGKFEGEYSGHMEPKLISHSAEMPRGEFIDPLGQKLIRLEGRAFVRRK
ncbi:hypothetical protein [Winogradskyella ursingii]|uniref:hypothetical protein n=1 Tax=Winogradskyella ursingii TaxID=2686079 RepID=UPI0015CA23BB|nr:hypothetical protein [Winogradskyella ursingii]